MTPIIISFIIITLVNVLAYIIAYKKQSDHLTDISYSLCFVAVVIYFYLAYGEMTLGRSILSLMVLLWGIRLGGFLFYRIHKMGRDERFDAFRGSSTGFLKFWILQSISICIIVLPVLFGLGNEALTVSWIAVAIWLIGWVIQAIADWQKFIFKQTHAQNEFIQSGLYKYIRHPNYTGEIMMWVAIFIYVMPFLSGWQWLSIISPIWIVILLVFISGIPLIEVTYKKKYGENADHKAYLKNSYRLIPFLY